MATITIQIADSSLQIIIEALSEGWPATIENAQGQQVPNPVSRGEWARQQLIRLVREKVREYRHRQAIAISTASDWAAIAEASGLVIS